MSEWEWENIINDPERQEAANESIAAENRRRAEKEDKLCQFHRNNAQRKKTRVEIQACKYLMGALTAGVAAYFAGYGGIGWLAWVLGGAAAIMAGVAIYGLGRVKEMGKAIEKAASRCTRPESGAEEYPHAPSVTEDQEGVNAE